MIFFIKAGYSWMRRRLDVGNPSFGGHETNQLNLRENPQSEMKVDIYRVTRPEGNARKYWLRQVGMLLTENDGWCTYRRHQSTGNLFAEEVKQLIMFPRNLENKKRKYNEKWKVLKVHQNLSAEMWNIDE